MALNEAKGIARPEKVQQKSVRSESARQAAQAQGEAASQKKALLVAAITSDGDDLELFIEYSPSMCNEHRLHAAELLSDTIAKLRDIPPDNDPDTARTEHASEAVAKLEQIISVLESLRDTQEYSLSPLTRAAYASISNDARGLWKATEDYDLQRLLAVVEAALGNPDGVVDTPAIESVVLRLAQSALASFTVAEGGA